MKLSKKLIMILGILILVPIMVIVLYKVIPRYTNQYSKGNISKKVDLIIGVKDRSDDIVNDILIKENKILLSFEDMNRFIDAYILINGEKTEIITNSVYHTKVIDISNKKMREYLTADLQDIYLEKIDDKIYFDLNELQEVYGIQVKYIEKTNTVHILKNIHEYKIGEVSKKTKLMKLPSIFSAKIDKLKEKSKVYIIKEDKEYYQILDEYGRYGYIKQKDVSNIKDEKVYVQEKYDKKINLLWEYVYADSPDISGEEICKSVNIISPTWFELVDDTGKIKDKVSTKYIQDAKQKGYDVWPIFTNESKIKTTSTIMKDRELRECVVKNILELCEKYSLEGINVDFEYMYKEDKDLYSQFIRELSVAFNKKGIMVSVDVTVPDGSDNYSLCYDRKALGEYANYIILMAYDQTSQNSNKPGSGAAADWVEKNINKLLLEVDKEKLVLGIPLYSRLWKISSDDVSTSVVNLKDVNALLTKNEIKTLWLDNEKQNYAEYSKGNDTYKIWIENIESIEEKLKLFEKYELSGIAFWEKGRENNDLWEIVSKYINN